MVDRSVSAPGSTRGGLASRPRGTCRALPEVTERPSHGAPTWFVRDRQSFLMLWEHGHHHNQFPHLWCAAPPGARAELVAGGPDAGRNVGPER